MERITKALIIKFVSEHKVELDCTHQNLCVPIIDRIYRKMLAGIRFTEIKVENNLICDGHHRYLASLLAKHPMKTVPSVSTSATEVISWESVNFVEDDWDTPAKIKMLNDIDADYNNIPVEKLVDLLK